MTRGRRTPTISERDEFGIVGSATEAAESEAAKPLRGRLALGRGRLFDGAIFSLRELGAERLIAALLASQRTPFRWSFRI